MQRPQGGKRLRSCPDALLGAHQPPPRKRSPVIRGIVFDCGRQGRALRTPLQSKMPFSCTRRRAFIEVKAVFDKHQHLLGNASPSFGCRVAQTVVNGLWAIANLQCGHTLLLSASHSMSLACILHAVMVNRSFCPTGPHRRLRLRGALVRFWPRGRGSERLRRALFAPPHFASRRMYI